MVGNQLQSAQDKHFIVAGLDRFFFQSLSGSIPSSLGVEVPWAAPCPVRSKPTSMCPPFPLDDRSHGPDRAPTPTASSSQKAQPGYGHGPHIHPRRPGSRSRYLLIDGLVYPVGRPETPDRSATPRGQYSRFQCHRRHVCVCTAEIPVLGFSAIGARSIVYPHPPPLSPETRHHTPIPGPDGHLEIPIWSCRTRAHTPATSSSQSW
jgi:hypothetical protein